MAEVFGATQSAEQAFKSDDSHDDSVCTPVWWRSRYMVTMTDMGRLCTKCWHYQFGPPDPEVFDG